MLISVIIPIYNAEKYLPKCLNSVINQTYRNLEIILINDGSTDNSGQICDLYAKSDCRIIVLHKKNGGVSSARNTGLVIARGNYISFVDPDDWIEPEMYERLYYHIREYTADIAIGGYVKESGDGNFSKPYKGKVYVYDNKSALNLILKDDGFKGFLCNKLFSADLFHSNPSISLDENIHFCEDLLCCCECFLKSSKIVYDTYPYYHYIIHNNNISLSNYSTKKLTSLTAVERIIEYVKEIDEININQFINYFMHLNISLLLNGLFEKKCKANEYNIMKVNLRKYSLKLITNKRVLLSTLLGRISIKLLFLIWKKFFKKNDIYT